MPGKQSGPWFWIGGGNSYTSRPEGKKKACAIAQASVNPMQGLP